MSVGDVQIQYFCATVSFQKGAEIRRMFLPCILYSSEVKLKNYLNKCGIVLEHCSLLTDADMFLQQAGDAIRRNIDLEVLNAGGKNGA